MRIVSAAPVPSAALTRTATSIRSSMRPTARSTATTCNVAFGKFFMKLEKVDDSASTKPSGQLQRTLHWRGASADHADALVGEVDARVRKATGVVPLALEFL